MKQKKTKKEAPAVDVAVQAAPPQASISKQGGQK